MRALLIAALLLLAGTAWGQAPDQPQMSSHTENADIRLDHIVCDESSADSPYCLAERKSSRIIGLSVTNPNDPSAAPIIVNLTDPCPAGVANCVLVGFTFADGYRIDIEPIDERCPDEDRQMVSANSDAARFKICVHDPAKAK